MTPRGFSRGRGKLLKQKAKRRKKAKLPPAESKVVYRDKTGKFDKQNSRKKQSVQILGEKGIAPAKRRSRDEVAKALSDITRKSEKAFNSTTTTGTMSDRILEAVDANGKALALQFAKKRQSGIVIVKAGDLSFTYSFGTQDLQEMLAGALTAYFQRAHSVRERVSAKARTGKGSHRRYSRYQGSVRVTVKLT